MRQIRLEADDRPVRRQKRPTKTRTKRRKKKTNGRAMSLGLTKILTAIVSPFGVLKNTVKRISGLTNRSPTKKAASRRTGKYTWARVALYGGIVLACATPVGLAGYFIIQQSLIEKSVAWINDGTDDIVVSLGLTIQEVSVAGRDRTASHSLMKALMVERNGNILQFDPEAARLRIEQLGWVEAASVMRRFPDEIFVRIVERRPYARWQLNGKTSVIDRNGAVVTADDKSEFRYLPKIVGIGANEDAADLFDMLSKTPALFTRLHNAVRIRERRWNLQFDNGVTVLLPEEGTKQAWSRLYRMQKEKKVLNKGVMAIDLRSNDKMYVRLRPDDAQIRRDAGNET